MNSWALVNLVFSAIGVILAVCAAIRIMTYKICRGKETNVRYSPADEAQTKRPRRIWFIVTIIMGFTGAYIFLLSQDLSGTMTYTDSRSIAHVFILAIEALSYSCIFARRESRMRWRERDISSLRLDPRRFEPPPQPPEPGAAPFKGRAHDGEKKPTSYID